MHQWLHQCLHQCAMACHGRKRLLPVVNIRSFIEECFTYLFLGKKSTEWLKIPFDCHLPFHRLTWQISCSGSVDWRARKVWWGAHLGPSALFLDSSELFFSSPCGHLGCFRTHRLDSKKSFPRGGSQSYKTKWVPYPELDSITSVIFYGSKQLQAQSCDNVEGNFTRIWISGSVVCWYHQSNSPAQGERM